MKSRHLLVDNKFTGSILPGRLSFAAMLICVLITGCKVGPDYHKPKESLPVGWKQAAPGNKAQAREPAREKEKLDKKALAEQQLWKNFNDPVLDSLISKGLAQNLDLKIAETRITEARSALQYAKVDLLPTVNIGASGIREGNQFALGKTSFPKPFNIFQTGFDASWEIDLFGRSRRTLESVFALFKSTTASRDDARVSLLAEIARTYMDIRRYQAQIIIEDKIVKARQHTLKIKQELFTAGSTPETDLIPAQTQLMQSQSQALYYQNMLATTEYAMDLLLAENPGSTHDIIAAVKPVPVADRNLVLAAPAEVIENRPDVRAAESRFAASVARIGVEKAKLFPDISISGFFGFLSANTDDLVSAPNKSWNIGGNILWPILNYGRISANINAANARENEALIEYKKAVISALVDVESALSSYNKQEANRDLMDKIVAKNKHAEDIANMRYKSGVAAFSDVLDAQKTLLAAQSQSVDATAYSAQALIAVYKSLGGGWKNPEPEPAKSPKN